MQVVLNTLNAINLALRSEHIDIAHRLGKKNKYRQRRIQCNC